jgi:hypothetical protein
VVLDRSFGELQSPGDLAVAVTAGHEAQHFDLPRRQGIRRVEARKSRFRDAEAAHDALGHDRLDRRPAGGDGAMAPTSSERETSFRRYPRAPARSPSTTASSSSNVVR